MILPSHKIRKMYLVRQNSLTTNFMLAAAYLNLLMFFNKEEDVAGNPKLSKGFKAYIVRYVEHRIAAGPNHDKGVLALILKIQMESLEAQKKLPVSSVGSREAQLARVNMAPA